MERAAFLIAAFGLTILVSAGCSSRDDFVPDTCPLGERRCYGGAVQECVSHLIVNEWEIDDDCSASGQTCTTDGAICGAAGVSAPCCH